MNAQQIAQVANFLNVAPNAIKRCEEWASVLFVQVHGCRPRFVSKKVLKAMTGYESIKSEFDAIYGAYAQSHGRTVDTEKAFQKFWEVPAMFAQSINELEPLSRRVHAYKKTSRKDVDKTSQALNSMYGRNGWDERDREDYEG